MKNNTYSETGLDINNLITENDLKLYYDKPKPFFQYLGTIKIKEHEK